MAGQSHLNRFHSRPPTIILSLLPIILSLSKDRAVWGSHGAMKWTRMAPLWLTTVYMLRCSDGSYYVGHTNDLEHRLAAHERGAIEGYTLSRRPVELVFSDQFSTRLEAFHRERQIRGWSRARKEALIKGDWDGLVGLSNRSIGQAILRQAQDEG